MYNNHMNLLIKFSGEFFTSKDDISDDGKLFLQNLKKEQINSLYFVVGGGNRMRGKDSEYSRNGSDTIGVLSTIMNGYIMQEYLKILGMKSEIFSHFFGFGKMYNPFDAIKSFNNCNVVILTSGLGQVGYVSSDLSSVIKSLELNVDAMIKVTKVAGVYDRDPHNNKDAKLLQKISYEDVIKNNLSFMDVSAINIAKENDLSIGVTNAKNFIHFLNKNGIGSIVGKDFR